LTSGWWLIGRVRGTLVLTADGQIDPLSTIDNSDTLLLTDGTHTLGYITGADSTLVGSSAQHIAANIVQGTLTIGGDFS